MQLYFKSVSKRAAVILTRRALGDYSICSFKLCISIMYIFCKII